jgi:hypothetical protein
MRWGFSSKWKLLGKMLSNYWWEIGKSLGDSEKNLTER